MSETVTETRTTYVDHAGFRFAVLTLENNSHRPVTLGPASLAWFEAAVGAIDVSRVDAVAVTGEGSVFCDGADLKMMTDAAGPEQAEDVARRGLDALGRLAALPVPTFAFINGTALGGGLELALHANYRTAADSVRAMGFPEVRLGLVPGWGGIPRTVALLGATETARLVITDSLAGKNLSARRAAELGLVDVILPEDGFLPASLDFAAGLLSRPAMAATAMSAPATEATAAPQTSKGHGPSRTVMDGSAALDAVRRQLDVPLRGAAPAPYRALELIAAAAAVNKQAGASAVNTAGNARDLAEIKAFGELLLSDEARASIYAFHLTQSLAKKPAGRPAAQPLPVRSVGVVGAGLMASQLALVFAQQLRVPVRITDLSPDRIDIALAWIAGQLDKLVNRGHLTATDAQAIRVLITGGTDKAAFADCDVVIEAVFEQLEVKRAVFAELEPLLPPETLLLTNTSSLSIEAMGASLARPGRLIGFHFFNPVAVLPLVEIIAVPQTDETTLATGFELAKRLRKTAVLATDTAGFVVNRVLTRLFDEVLALIDEGSDPMVVNHALDPLGLPMTPLALLQFIGPAVQLHICETMHQAYPQRFGVSRSLTMLVAAGLPGYLDHDGGLSPSAAALLPPTTLTDAGKVRATLLGALAEEVTVMLDESVVAGPEEVDLCMILGANFPFHTGGLTPLLDREVGSAFHPELRVPVPAAG
ncbi:3-hydroxyacyl-CoA dehydrogenase/enoyl-CoA hydratase/carnithine racemase [Arthrobacter pascens]|uniref:3-hydroxyacyl-CoA dehydrogenase NAD-binding domain-containing protein n=1 Tax=Arthrobacter pascens TaxID=1677 RepID=UPI0027915640|nr:3-hydroxyacyl-CoA dehydrogenase NAD-binding domain-containing protein [Arthrobacter pascens]MDQ0678612.1 3-hydroxyacyl-CoA dehydrogenase/enoyl-CoA hydratase/carnithine racemase [Arthrobacter pascens]